MSSNPDVSYAPCPTCLRVFGTDDEVIRHLDTHEAAVLPFFTLGRVYVLHRDPLTRYVACPYTGCSLRTKLAFLYMHLREAHRLENPPPPAPPASSVLHPCLLGVAVGVTLAAPKHPQHASSSAVQRGVAAGKRKAVDADLPSEAAGSSKRTATIRAPSRPRMAPTQRVLPQKKRVYPTPRSPTPPCTPPPQKLETPTPALDTEDSSSLWEMLSSLPVDGLSSSRAASPVLPDVSHADLHTFTHTLTALLPPPRHSPLAQTSLSPTASTEACSRLLTVRSSPPSGHTSSSCATPPDGVRVSHETPRGASLPPPCGAVPALPVDASTPQSPPLPVREASHTRSPTR